MLPSESMIMSLARKHIRGAWMGLALTTVCICSVIFIVPRPLTDMNLNIAIGVILVATIAAGIATFSLTRLALLEIDLHNRKKADEKENAAPSETLANFEETPPPTTEEDDIVLWDDPTTEETETEEIIVEAANTRLSHQLPPASFFHKGLLAAACTLAFFLNLTLIYWYIEDAAISFAYAKHFAAGEGLVTYLGGERVEGYSNPLWTLLLAIGYLLGVDGFTSSKALGLFFNVLTVPLVYEITRHLRPNKQDATPIIAAFLVAGNAQFAIWGASGLENSLFNCLLACGIWRVLVEARNPQLPYSALFFFALAITRPEGILYAAFAGLWFTICCWQWALYELRETKTKGTPPSLNDILKFVGPPLAWLALFFGPFMAYHYARYSYFGWEFPNTYYAKKGHRVFEPFRWTKRGWRYLRDYSYNLWQGFFLPIYLLAMTGSGRRQRVVWWTLVIALGVALWYPYPEFAPRLDVGPHLNEIIAVVGGCLGISLTWLALGSLRKRRWPSVEYWLFTALTLIAATFCGLWVTEVLEPPMLGSWRTPQWWIEIRVWSLLGIAIAGLLACVFRPGWRGLGLCWGLAFCSVFFSLYATGDWMKGFRWMASLIVTTSPLLAIGWATLADWIDTEYSGAFQELTGQTFALFAIIFSVMIGVFFGIPPVVEALEIDTQLWPIDTISAIIFFPIALIIGLLLGKYQPTDHHWRSVGYAVVIGGMALTLIPQFHHLDWFTRKPETGPFSVRKRVNYNLYLKNRLHLEHASILDVDMGATMYWSGLDIVDIAGLVDVSMGHHWMEKPFIRQYIFEERKPTFAHVHGAWARTSKIPQHPEWRRDYLEVPGYPTSKRSLHLGNHIRRDLMMTPRWEGKRNRQVVFENGVMLMGWKTAGEQLAPGRKMYIEVALKTPFEDKKDDFRLIGFVAGPEGELKSFEIPPGYDWYPPHKWGTKDTFFGRYSLSLPLWFKSGRYDVGFVLIDSTGQVVPPKTSSEIDPEVTQEVFVPKNVIIGTEEYAKVAVGEIRFSRVLQMSSEEDLVQMAGNDVEEALQTAEGEQCERAEQLWRRAKLRLTKDTVWANKASPTVHAALARCWAVRATRLDDYSAQVPLWEKARLWDRWEPSLKTRRLPTVGHWVDTGQRAREAEDWAAAYEAFANVMRIDPTQSHVRRWAEECRDQMLGLVDDEEETSSAPAKRVPSPMAKPLRAIPSLNREGVNPSSEPETPEGPENEVE